MSYSILTEARIKPSAADLQPVERSYAVHWSDNADLQGWTSIFNLDIVGAWGGFLYGTKRTSTTGSIGPTNDFPPVDALVNDRMFFRMKYDKHPKNNNLTNQGKIQWTTTSDPVFNDDKSITFEVFPDGKWHFYEIDVGQTYEWVGSINNVRFFPCINGYINDEFFLNFFEIGTTDFTFSLDNSSAGIPGKVVGSKILSQSITIEKGVNDTLLVNIDGYGDVQIVLTPQTAIPAIIARDISLQLGKVSIGGYLRAEAYIDPDSQKLTIESGTRAADSTVSIGGGSAGFVLGLLDEVGTFLGTTTQGTDPSPSYTPLSSYRLTTLEVMALFDNDNELPAFSLDPQSYVVQAGRADYGTTNQDLKTTFIQEARYTDHTRAKVEVIGALSGEGKTFVDLNHPFSDDGKLELVAFNGEADVNGGTKWKIFRPKLNGDLELVNEGVIGETSIIENPNGGLVLTTTPGAFSVDLSSSDVWVRRGDLIGIYNASFHLFSSNASKANAMYYEFDGDTSGTVTPTTPSGAGELGLPIYARGAATKNRAVVDIDLGRRLNLDRLIVTGEEEVRDLEYNVAAAASSQFSVDAPGTHTICYVYNVTYGWRTCFERSNQGFNVQALNDGVVLADNGISSFGDGGVGGSGGANVEGATYFYVNGDAEFLGTHEFVGLGPEAYNFARDTLGIDCYFTTTTPRLDKPIGKAVIYFKDKKNQRAWQIETALGSGAKGGNGSKPGFQLVPELTSVKIDDKEIRAIEGIRLSTKDPDSSQNLLLGNPVVLDVIARDGTRNPQKGVDFVNDVGELGGVNVADQLTYAKFQWNRFEWNFDAIRSTGFRWYCDYHWSTKISEFQVFAVSDNAEALGDNTQPLFSADGEVFTTGELKSSTTSQAVYKLGGSPQYIRLVFRPTLKLDIYDVSVVFEEDQICLGEEGRITTGAIAVEDARIGQVGSSTPLKITNTMGETADLILDIPADINTSRQLLYSNQLKSANDILYPEIGPPGRIDFKADKVIKEEKNVANKARCYGLRNVASGTVDKYISDNLLTNPGFELGDASGWDVNVIQSGTAVDGAGVHYQVPRVMNINLAPDEDSALYFQTGNYVFGFNMEDAKATGSVVVSQYSLLGSASRDGPYIPIEFEISQVVDVSDYADQIDAGGVVMEINFRYIMYFENSADPTVSVYGAPTASGVSVAYDTYIDGYGTTLLRSKVLGISDPVWNQNLSSSTIEPNLFVQIKEGTRFVRLHLYIDAETYKSYYSKRQKVLLDDFEARLAVPSATEVRWYKGWRGGTGAVNEFDGFTDSRFEPITAFTKTIGSTHWWQPWDQYADNNTPESYQSQGFSTVFEFDRLVAIQSFRRMTATDPGFLGAQWDGEREVAGLKIGLWYRSPGYGGLAGNHPNHFHLEVLKTRAELGGVEPDIDNPAHLKIVRTYRSFGSKSDPSYLAFGTSTERRRVFASRLMILLFEDGPIATEGMRIVFTCNCDRFEYNVYATMDDYKNTTTCPTMDPVWSWGLGATAFTPLESLNLTSLPLDNTREGNLSGNVYAAVDLRRRYDISTDSDLFELIARTPTNSKWTTGSVAYSADEIDDPNQVTWGGNSSNARWVRFVTGSTDENEFVNDVIDYGSTASNMPPHVYKLPQAVLDQARIYPNIQTTSIHTVGYNSAWDDLEYVLTDQRSDTFIYYSDYPIIALDLGKKYLISNTEVDVIRQRHELIAGIPGVLDDCDYTYWDGNNEDNFTYSLSSGGSLARPETVPFRAFGAGVPDYPTRWVAFKGMAPLLCQNQPSDEPKMYNFHTVGQALFEASVRPRSPEVVTNNASWFTTKKAILRDISTFDFELGIPFDVTNGVDYGSHAGATSIEGSDDAANDLGDPYNAFDGIFDEAIGDVWGVSVRDPLTNLNDSDKAFPHSIWRVFRDPLSGEVLTRDVKAVFLRGFNEFFYPKSFRFQNLLENSDGSIKDPTLTTSWDNIEDAIFTDVDTYQEGLGFFYIFPETVSTKGIRVYISDSEYPDDNVVTQTDPDSGQPNSTFADISGPQTRVAELVIYDQTFDEAVLEGELVTNHALGATVASTTFVPDQGPEKTVDGDLSTFWQSTGFQDTLTITLSRPSTITHFEWEKDQQLDQLTGGVSQNAPQDFTLTALVGTVYQQLLDVEGHLGTTYSGTFSEPVTSDTFVFDITRVQGQQADASSIQISEIRLQEVFTQTTPLATVESVPDRRPGSTNQTSTKVVYAAEADAVAQVYAGGLDCGSDPDFSERDFFNLWVHINDVSLLDTGFGSIKLGNSSQTCYKWNLSGMNLQSGWNELKLQFSRADDNSPIAFQPGAQYSPDTGFSQVDFTTEDVEATSSVDGVFHRWIIEAPGIRYFELEFRGSCGSRELELVLDDFRIVRNTFEDVCRFGPSLYLNNNETFTVNIEGLDLAIGTVEFWMQPDWDTGGRLRANNSIIPAIFRIMRSDGSFLSFFYRPNQGFIGMVYDTKQLWQFITSISEYRFERYDTFHVAVVWDHRARIEPHNASFVIYVNAAPVFGTDQQWEALREPGASVVFGGEVGQNFAAAPFNATALTFSPVPSMASSNTASSWALIENLKMYNYAKTNFSDINNQELVRTQLINPSEMLEISTDNANFYGMGSDSLPLVVKAVPNNTSTTVYLRTNIPNGLTGDESRDASLLVRWKTPLRSCS